MLALHLVALAAAVQAAPPQDDSRDVIEIVGTRPDQVQKIDRRSYRVKETPHAAQQDSVQLLRGLPAVSISPDDQISILGSPGVTLQVDGRTYQGDAAQYLRTLHGSDIERIEIITNPSAEFSSAGSGGIINIVLRRKIGDGLSGSAYAKLSTLPQGEASATVKHKKGSWSEEVQAQGSAGTNSRSRYEKYRVVDLSSLGGDVTIDRETGRSRNRQAFGFINAKASYEANENSSYSAALYGGGVRNSNHGNTSYVGVTDDFGSFDQRGESRASEVFVGLELTSDHKGKREGETLKGSLSLYGNPDSRWHESLNSDRGNFSFRRDQPSLFASGKVDWQHPAGKSDILSLGATIDREHDRFRYDFINLGSPDLGPSYSREFAGNATSIAAYGTYQHAFGTWTVMPGARAELYLRSITSPGYGTRRVSRARLFPSFHLDHPLGKFFTLALSYSKRIDRPQLDNLRPYSMISGRDTILVGNPLLRDQSSDAYELNLHFRRKSLDAGLILYDRETHGLWSNFYSVNAEGMNFVQLINSGHKRDRGAELDVSLPLLKRVKGSASVNLFDSRFPVDPFLHAGYARSLRSTGNATIDWTGAERGKVPGDVAQVQLQFFSRERGYQIVQDAYYALSLAYTHSFSRKLSVTANAEDLGTRSFHHLLQSPYVFEDYRRHGHGPSLGIKLSRTFGGTP